MYSTQVVQPLSPPTSPRMSGQDPKPVESLWNEQRSTQPAYASITSRSLPPNTLSGPCFYPSRQSLTTGANNLPNIHDAYSNVGQASLAHTSGQSHTASGDDYGYSKRGTGVKDEFSSPHQPRDSVVQANASSAPLKGSQRMAYDESGDDDDDDDDDELVDAADPDKDSQESKPMTAAEARQAAKKKKRFRLSHADTKLLQNEFAIQAHPDAAHRERLSRRIKGLSPRQVQVWFQNRRAKLKRLTADDRDRIIKSRALPDEYMMGGMPMNQPFHPSLAPTGATTPGMPQDSVMPRFGDMRPLGLDTLRRGSDQSYVSPTSVMPGLGSLAFTPPQSASDVQSPATSNTEMSFGYGHHALMEQRRPLLPPSSNSAPTFSGSYGSQLGRVPSYDRLRTSGSDQTSSPLRTSMSFAGFQNPSPTQQSQQEKPEGSPSIGSHGNASRGSSQRAMPPPSAPIGLGFSYDNVSSYRSNAQSQPQTQSTSGPSQSTYRAGAAPSTNSGSYPSYFDYQNPQYSSPQVSQYQASSYGGSYSAPLPSNPFPSSLQQQQSQYSQPQQQGGQYDRAKDEQQGGSSIGGVY